MYMKRAYSIAAARAKLPAIVRAAEHGEPVTLARRGTPVAIVLSLSDYRRLEQGEVTLEAAWRAFRQRHAAEGVELSRREVASWRSRELGRKVELGE
jgi:prevent-host-death family protein